MSEEEIQATEEEIVEQDETLETKKEKEVSETVKAYKKTQEDEEVEGVDLEEDVPKGQESKYGL